MAARTHTCAATGCQHQIAAHLLMCMDHWRMVPAPLRRDVLATYKACMQPKAPDAALAARQGYRSAVAAAVAAVAEKQTKKNRERTDVLGDLFAQPTECVRKQLSKKEHGNTIQQPKQ